MLLESKECDIVILKADLLGHFPLLLPLHHTIILSLCVVRKLSGEGQARCWFIEGDQLCCHRLFTSS